MDIETRCVCVRFNIDYYYYYYYLKTIKKNIKNYIYGGTGNYKILNFQSVIQCPVTITASGLLKIGALGCSPLA